MLRAARREHSWTQAELAQRARVSRAFVIDIELGKRSGAELGRVLAMMRALGVAINLVPDNTPMFEQALDALVRRER